MPAISQQRSPCLLQALMLHERAKDFCLNSIESARAEKLSGTAAGMVFPNTASVPTTQ